MMDDHRKLAFTFAGDTTKQLLTLSTGILALTITFARDVLRSVTITALVIAWFIYIISILAGVITLMVLTGILEPAGDKAATAGESTEPSIRHPKVTQFSVIQAVAFIGATICVLASGIATSCSGGQAPAPDSTSVTSVHRQVIGAYVDSDWRGLDTLLADGWTASLADSVLFTKPELLRRIQSRQRPAFKLVDNIDLHVYTTFAIGSGFFELQDQTAINRFGTFFLQYDWAGSTWKLSEVTLYLFPVADSLSRRH
ncbi:MAG TPA: hypothetical protein VF746_07600 [Longimicrobium sp.]|jgi:hypothetical protein